MALQSSRPLLAILPPGSWSKGHALQKLGTPEYRWFKGSFRYLQQTSDPAVWAERARNFEQAAASAPRGTIPDWSSITGKKGYLDSMREVSTQIRNSRSISSFDEPGVAESYNRVARGAGRIRQYRVDYANSRPSTDAGHKKAIEEWGEQETMLSDGLTEEELASGFAKDGSCVAAEAIGVGEEVAEVLDTLAVVFL